MHPFHAHRQHKVEKDRVSHIAGHKHRASGGRATHSDEKQDRKLIGETIGAFFDRQVETFRDREALVVRHQKVRWSWGELARRVDDLAAGLMTLGLERGDRFTMRDLVYGLLLPSGADAAIAIGRHVSGSDAAFVRDLNAFVDSVGLTDTHFTDADGLGGPNHYSTARDIGLLSRYAMRQPFFAQVVRSEEWRAAGSRTITVYNTHPWEFGYPGADGVKSGFTEEAGPTLSSSATRFGHRVIIVVLNSPRRNADTTALMDWAFNTFCWGDGALGCAAR